MSEHIRKARLHLQDVSYSEYFKELNQLKLPPRLKNKLNLLQDEMIIERLKLGTEGIIQLVERNLNKEAATEDSSSTQSKTSKYFRR